MIHLIAERASPDQIQSMSEEYGGMIKIAVDIRQVMLSGGGEMHADCEQMLLENGSEQDDIWGANWYPADQRLEYEALINIRLQMGNRSMLIQSEAIRQKVEGITRALLGDVR